MGVRNLREICLQLMENGRDPETPAAMIQSAFWPGEKIVTGTLTSIADEVEKAGIEPPATLVIGKVAAFRAKVHREV
jgi:siroheme synthase